MSFLKAESLVKDSPTSEYDACFHVLTMSLLDILYEKHPPFLFFSSSHIGVIPFLIKNNIQLKPALAPTPKPTPAPTPKPVPAPALTKLDSQKLINNSGGTFDGLEYEKVYVSRVVDGDTIGLDDGRKIRYLGIDTPETVHPSKDVQCFGPEASKINKELVLNKKKRLKNNATKT